MYGHIGTYIERRNALISTATGYVLCIRNYCIVKRGSPTKNEREKEKGREGGKSHIDNFKWNIIALIKLLKTEMFIL